MNVGSHHLEGNRAEQPNSVRSFDRRCGADRSQAAHAIPSLHEHLGRVLVKLDAMIRQANPGSVHNREHRQKEGVTCERPQL